MLDFKLVCYPSRQRKDGRTQVRISATIKNNKAVILGTGVFVFPSQFEHRKIVKHENAERLNAELARQLYKIQSWSLDYIRKHGKISSRALKAYQKNNQLKFIAFARKNLAADHNLAKATKKRYKVGIRHVEDYCPDATLDEMNYQWFYNFDAHLKKLELQVNTRSAILKCIRTFLRRAAKLGLMDISDVPHYKLKEVKSDRTALTEEELKSIEQMEFGEKEAHLYAIKDLFLFSCYTGLRFQDLISLTARNFRVGKDGLELHFRAQKTSKLLTLPLEIIFYGRGKEIAEKYLSKIKKGRDLDKPIFKNITNQYANRSIREIALKAGIYKKVTMHVGRHTFGTLMALRVSPKMLQELMQHNKIETTMIYVHLSNKDINNALKIAFK